MIKHLAVIMDGNRRWATSHHMAKWFGHKEGVKSIDKAINFCIQKGIKFLSLYTFSLENMNRSKVELDYLFGLIISESKSVLKQALEKNIKIKFIGDRSLYPKDILECVIELEEKSKQCGALQLNILFFYGSKQEIFWGIKELIRKIKYGEIKEEELTDELFEECLWTHDIPEPELIIRTGGRQRLSNFLLYQSAYSEIVFLDLLWPDITENDFEYCLKQFTQSQRNFGV